MTLKHFNIHLFVLLFLFNIYTHLNSLINAWNVWFAYRTLSKQYKLQVNSINNDTLDKRYAFF